MKDKLKLITQLNWLKTLYINFKMLPFKEAVQLPILIWGGCRLDLKGGSIKFDTPIKRGILKIGYRYETFSYKEPVQFIVKGELIVKGSVWMGTAVHLLVEPKARLSIGNRVVIGSKSEITCTLQIDMDDFVRTGSRVEITDSNYHYTQNMETGAILSFKRPVHLAERNWLGTNAAILPGTITPPNLIIAYGSVCNKDYRNSIPQYSLIGGVTARLVKTNVGRIYESEREAEIASYFEQTGSEVYYAPLPDKAIH